MSLEWLNKPVKEIHNSFAELATAHQGQLTKPPGSLGKLEALAIRLAAMQASSYPSLDRVGITIFAGDHGIAEEGVSAFPQEVTAEMVRNFARGGAAINVLARSLNARLEVVNTGTVSELEALEGVYDQRVAPGTANFAKQPAMNDEELSKALDIGRQAVERAALNEMQLFIAGEMGIANTTSATAIGCALLNEPVSVMVGPGTGLDSSGVNRKASVIDAAIEFHKLKLTDPLAVLKYLGGFEVAAICGAYIAAAQAGIPILVDGFITTAAALVAVRFNPEVAQWLIFTHASKEPGHQFMLYALEAEPLIDLEMRLGEASGAAVSLPILRMACQLHSGMATFSQADVSEKL